MAESKVEAPKDEVKESVSDSVKAAQSKDAPSTSFIKLKHEYVRHADLHVSKVGGWLESRFHFRFAGWFPADKKRHGFGPLHVMNDDLVQPTKGFGFHPHQNQEIFSYVLNGNLTHKDSNDNEETLSRGAVQYMSAGEGVWHSEYNNNKKEVCRFLQTWIYPNKNDLKVQYGSLKIDKKERHNKILRILSGTTTSDKVKSKISLAQDVNVLVSEMDYGKKVVFELEKNRNLYFVCAEGECNINNGYIKLKMRDAVRIYGDKDKTATIEIEAVYKPTKKDGNDFSSCHFMMIEMGNKSTKEYTSKLR